VRSGSVGEMLDHAVSTVFRDRASMLLVGLGFGAVSSLLRVSNPDWQAIGGVWSVLERAAGEGLLANAPALGYYAFVVLTAPLQVMLLAQIASSVDTGGTTNWRFVAIAALRRWPNGLLLCGVLGGGFAAFSLVWSIAVAVFGAALHLQGVAWLLSLGAIAVPIAFVGISACFVGAIALVETAVMKRNAFEALNGGLEAVLASGDSRRAATVAIVLVVLRAAECLLLTVVAAFLTMFGWPPAAYVVIAATAEALTTASSVALVWLYADATGRRLTVNRAILDLEDPPSWL
jgi:hypothetical protein